MVVVIECSTYTEGEVEWLWKERASLSLSVCPDSRDSHDIFLFFLDADLRHALDTAHRDRHRVGCLALCWFAFQGVSMLPNVRDSACQQRLALSL